MPAPSPVLLSQVGSGVELPQLFSGLRRSGSLSRRRLLRSLEQVSFQSQPGPFTPLCSCLATRGARPLPVMSTHSGRLPGRSVQLLSPCQQRSEPSRPHFLSCSLLEESYVLRDPFTPDKGRFLVVGSRCSVCSRLVCVGPVGKPRAPGDAFPLSPVAGTSHAWSRER